MFIQMMAEGDLTIWMLAMAVAVITGRGVIFFLATVEATGVFFPIVATEATEF